MLRLTEGAALFDLPVPRIAVGAPANLALVDLEAVWIAGEHGWESRSDNCCFTGRRMRGRVVMTISWRAPSCPAMLAGSFPGAWRVAAPDAFA